MATIPVHTNPNPLLASMLCLAVIVSIPFSFSSSSVPTLPPCLFIPHNLPSLPTDLQWPSDPIYFKHLHSRHWRFYLVSWIRDHLIANIADLAIPIPDIKQVYGTLVEVIKIFDPMALITLYKSMVQFYQYHIAIAPHFDFVISNYTSFLQDYITLEEWSEWEWYWATAMNEVVFVPEQYVPHLIEHFPQYTVVTSPSSFSQQHNNDVHSTINNNPHNIPSTYFLDRFPSLLSLSALLIAPQQSLGSSGIGSPSTLAIPVVHSQDLQTTFSQIAHAITSCTPTTSPIHTTTIKTQVYGKWAMLCHRESPVKYAIPDLDHFVLSLYDIDLINGEAKQQQQQQLNQSSPLTASASSTLSANNLAMLNNGGFKLTNEYTMALDILQFCWTRVQREVKPHQSAQQQQQQQQHSPAKVWTTQAQVQQSPNTKPLTNHHPRLQTGGYTQLISLDNYHITTTFCKPSQLHSACAPQQEQQQSTTPVPALSSTHSDLAPLQYIGSNQSGSPSNMGGTQLASPSSAGPSSLAQAQSLIFGQRLPSTTPTNTHSNDFVSARKTIGTTNELLNAASSLGSLRPLNNTNNNTNNNTIIDPSSLGSPTHGLNNNNTNANTTLVYSITSSNLGSTLHSSRPSPVSGLGGGGNQRINNTSEFDAVFTNSGVLGSSDPNALTAAQLMKIGNDDNGDMFQLNLTLKTTLVDLIFDYARSDEIKQTYEMMVKMINERQRRPYQNENRSSAGGGSSVMSPSKNNDTNSTLGRLFLQKKRHSQRQAVDYLATERLRHKVELYNQMIEEERTMGDKIEERFEEVVFGHRP